MLKRTSRFFIFSLLASLMGLTEVHASFFSLPPRFSANALVSDYTVGQADLMLSTGDCAHNFYLNPDIVYGSDNQGYADLGVGYRWIQNNAAILGAYVFGGYSRIENNARLWVVNPGIEAMGSRWDARLNAYFPMGDRHYGMGGNDSLNLNYAVFIGHSAYSSANQLFYISQYAGEGADVKVGYQLFPQTPLKAYLGSYFFSPAQTSNIWGGAAGLEYWFDPHVKFMAGYTYDTLHHSTGALGIGVELGGTHIHRSDPCLEERITDPVERNLAELGRGSGIPSRRVSQFLANQAATLLANNIAFFSQTGTPNNGGAALTLANCTFENPCGPTDFSQPGINTLNSLLPNTLLFFNGGSYPALNVAGTGPITLNAGQSVHSRTANYLNPATGTARSTFNGAFILNTNNTLENTILVSTTNTANGGAIVGISANNILISGSQIGSSAHPFAVGVALAASNNATVENSTISWTNTGGTGVILNGSTIAIKDSNIDISATTFGSTGIQIDAGNSAATIINTSLTLRSATDVAKGLFLSTGNNSIVNISDSQITANGNSPFSGNAGVVINPGTTGNVVNAKNISFGVTNTGAGPTLVLSNAVASNSIIVDNSRLAVTASTATITNAVPVITITSSTCTVNGGSVLCP